MKTLYLKRGKKDNITCVFVYTDKKTERLKATINGSTSTLPNKQHKIITLNCWDYYCEWV